MEERGRRAASQEAPQPALLKDQLQAPTVHITRTTGAVATLPRLRPSPPKRNSPCTRRGSRRSRVPSEETSDLPAWGTSPAAPRARARIASTARAMGRARKVSTRTRGERVDTRTAPPTPARWRGAAGAAKTTAMKVSEFCSARFETGSGGNAGKVDVRHAPTVILNCCFFV